MLSQEGFQLSSTESYITYIDEDLEDWDAVWDGMKQHLEALDAPEQLELALLSAISSSFA